MKKARFTDITEGNILKQLIAFFIPVFLSSIFQQVYNMVDIWFVGNYVGADAIAAVGGSTGILINLMLGCFNGFASAVTVLIAQLFGSKTYEEIKQIICNSLLICIIAGGIIGGLGVMCSGQILTFLGVPEEIRGMAGTYVEIYFAGIIAVFVYNVSAGMLRALGDSRRPLYVLIFCCLANIALDALFIIGFDMGMRGASIATVCAQCASALCNLYFLLNHKSSCHIALREIRISPGVLKRIAMIGVPAAIQSMAYSIANLIMQSKINQFGTDTVAAVSVYNKIDMVCWWATTAFGYALTTFVGQNYGAGKMERIKKGVRICLVLSFFTEIAFSVLLILNAERYFMLFTDDADVIAIGVSIVYHITPFYVTYIFIDPLVGAIKGTGNTLIPMVITFIGVCVLRITWVEAVDLMHGSFFEIMYNYPFTWMVTSFLFLIYYLSGRWLPKLKKEL